MTGVKKDLLRKKESLRMLALSSQSRGQQRPEEVAGTRASEEETCPVLLVRALNDKECLTADEQRVCLDRLPEHRRDVSAALFGNIVRIRRKNNPFTQPVNADKQLRRIFSWYLPVKENYEPLYLGKVRPDDSVKKSPPGRSAAATRRAQAGNLPCQAENIRIKNKQIHSPVCLFPLRAETDPSSPLVKVFP